MADAVLQTYQAPVNLTATYLTEISWLPEVFTAVANNSNFSLNLWLLRHDASTDSVEHSYLNILLAENQNVFNTSVWWTPSVSEIDVSVDFPGNHQFSWEEYDDNPDVTPTIASDHTTLKDFSQGFHILAPPGYSSSSSSASSSTSTALSSSLASSSTQRPSTTASSAASSATSEISSAPLTSTSFSNTSSQSSNSLAIGLGVGLGLAAILSVISAVILLRRQKQRQGGARMVSDEDGAGGALDMEGKQSSASTELPAYFRPELPGGQLEPRELPDSQQKIELAANFNQKTPAQDPRYELD